MTSSLVLLGRFGSVCGTGVSPVKIPAPAARPPALFPKIPLPRANVSRNDTSIPAPRPKEPPMRACLIAVLALALTGALTQPRSPAADERDTLKVGEQPDGRIVVPTNQILQPA